MSSSNSRRFINEAKQIEVNKDNDASMFIVTSTKSMSAWDAEIYGPIDSLYAGYKFELSIVLPSDYPTAPMIVKFKTPISHVNVNSQGDICLDVLKQNWSPVLNIRSILISLMGKLVIFLVSIKLP